MIAIIGGGISGLTCAYYLEKMKVPYKLFEANSQAGGLIKTVRNDWGIMETGPNSLLLNDDLKSFLVDLGLEREIITASDVAKNRYMYRKGRYRKLPSSPKNLLFNTYLSWGSKMKIMKERKLKSSGQAGETVADFIGRRFSDEIVQYLLQPFIAGIYGGDANELLVEQAFPKLYEYEKKYGSVIAGFKANKSLARPTTVSFKNGMQQLVETLSTKVNAFYGVKVGSVLPDENGYVLMTTEGPIDCKYVVFATPPKATAELVQNISQEATDKLRKLRMSSMAVTHTIYEDGKGKKALQGFGALHPKSEGLYCAGHIWSSQIFPHQANEGRRLITSFVGGRQQQSNFHDAESNIKQKVGAEIKRLYGIDEEVVYQSCAKWDSAIPQYDVHQKEVVDFISANEWKNVSFCVNWKDGISVPQCIAKGKALAVKIAKGK